MAPIKIGFVKLKKCNAILNKLLIGIDQGCTLTKTIFLNIKNQDQLFQDRYTFVTFQWSLFRNDDFENCLQFILDNAYIPDDCKLSIHITGVGSYSNCEILKSKFGLQVSIIPEELSVAAGAIIGLSNIGPNSLTKAIIKPQTIEAIRKHPFKQLFLPQTETIGCSFSDVQNSVFPCLVFQCGSASGFLYIDEEGKGEHMGILLGGGKTLLGLAKCLLDVNNYETLVELASQGCREHIDTHLKDILGNSSSMFLQSAQDVTLFSFGNLDDLEFDYKNMRPADLARSLIGLYCVDVYLNCTILAKIKGLSKVYLNGNIFQSEIFAEEFRNPASVFPFTVELVILDFGYSGCLAAMLCDEEMKAQYLR